MSRRYEAWAGRAITRDDQGQFATSPGQNLLVRRLSAAIGQRRGEDDDYKMQHQPPDREYGAPIHDPETMAPGLMAHPEWYGGTGDPKADREAMAALRKAVAGGPDTEITVYRAAVAQGGIAPTNWVTTSRTYAKMHAGDDPDYRIFSRKVRAGDLFWEGNSIAEWGWVPEAPGFEARTVRRSR
jgi:hypothetical protein